MLSGLTHAVYELVATYGYIAVFVVILLESAGVPLPGETILVAASIFAGSHSTLDIRLIIQTAAAGAILGDNIGYWVGRTVGRRLLLKYGDWIGLDQRKLDLGEYLFLLHGGKIVFVARFVALLRVFAAVLAGANRFPPWRFLLFNVLGGCTWALTFGMAGYWLGHSFQRLEGTVGWLLPAAAITALFFSWRYYKRHEARLIHQAERDLREFRNKNQSANLLGSQQCYHTRTPEGPSQP